MRRARIWIASIVAVIAVPILAAAIYVLFFFDWNMLRGPIEARVSAATGREFAIDGDLEGEFALSPHVRMHQVRLANAEWAADPNMVEIESMDARIDLLGLLSGGLTIPLLHVRGARVTLEVDSEGRANWDMGDPPEAPDDRTEIPVIEQLIVENSRVLFVDHGRQLEFDMAVNQAAAHSQADGALPLEIEGDGVVQAQPFTVQGRGGSILALREADAPYPIDIAIEIGATTVRLAGTLDDPFDFDRLDVELHVAGPTPSDLAPVLQIPLPTTSPYALTGRLRRDGASWRYEDFTGNVGESDLAGSVAVDIGGDRPQISADLVSDKLYIADLAPLIGVPRDIVDGAAAGSPRRILPDAPLQHDQLRAADANVTFRGTRVLAPGLPLQQVVAEIEIEDGVLRLSPFRFDLADGSLAIYTSVYATADPVQADYDLRLSDVNLGSLLAAFEGEATGTLHGRARFSTRGDTIRRAFATAEGGAMVAMGPGRIEGSTLALLDVGLLEALAVVLANGQPQPMDIRCFVASFEIKDGVMSSAGTVLDTENSVISAEGTIDLRDETLALRVSAEPKSVSLTGGRVPVEVAGPITDPSVQIDPTEPIVRGALAVGLGALLTPLAALIPLFDAGLAEDAECSRLIAEGEQRQAN
ncbi:MAG: AsmA family protein [Alphaproteobacteria bacterium]